MNRLHKWFRRSLCAALTLTVSASAAGATNWGLWYGNGAHQPPSGEDTAQTLLQYGAYYMGDAAEKTLYLTFDCGYENGNTGKILDTLKQQHVPAAFFLTGPFVDEQAALVQRMADEGHLACNHTNNHPNMTTVSHERFAQELQYVADHYQALTGQTIAPFYRPPEGAYTYDNLRWAQSLGYHTTLWSVAYGDWDTANQPARASALQTVRSRVHNGAVILLHAVSSTNAAILDELITGWKAAGYTFSYLTALPYLNETHTAVPSDAQFSVNGQTVTPSVYRIGGENYLKLRDLAAALSCTEKGFSVGYDSAANTVSLSISAEYAPLGNELAGAAKVAAAQAKPTRQTITLDGQPAAFTAYVIAGSNYVRLRDLAAALNCGVTYDPATKSVGLDTAADYVD